MSVVGALFWEGPPSIGVTYHLNIGRGQGIRGEGFFQLLLQSRRDLKPISRHIISVTFLRSDYCKILPLL
jgi:hypothetical protein